MNRKGSPAIGLHCLGSMARPTAVIAGSRMGSHPRRAITEYRVVLCPLVKQHPVANYFILVCMASLPRPAPSLTPPSGDCLVRVSLGSALPDTMSARLTSPPRAFKVSGALLERKRHTSPGTPDYIKADVYIKTARFALDLLKIKRGTYTTPRRQNHYDPKGY